MTLHVPTLLLTSAIISALVAALQCVMASRLRAPALNYWAAGNIASAAGTALVGLRAELPLALSVILGNGLIFVSLGLMLSGVRVFDGRRSLLAPLTISAGGCTGLLVLSLASGDWLGERIVIGSLAIALWCAATAATLLQTQAPRGRSLARTACAGLLLVLAVLYALRAIGVAQGWLSADSAFSGAPQAALVLAGLAMATGWNFCSLFMVLDRLVSTDDLTGLLNRRTTLLRGRDLFDDARARHRSISLLMVDLDHFKSINDRFGHHVGDAVLQRFAQMAGGSLRSSDLIGRLGGEEFCIIVPGADAQAALEVAERLRRTTEQKLRYVLQRPVHVTVTVGIATHEPHPRRSAALTGLMRAADEALYLAKAQGRNRVLSAVGTDGPQTASPQSALA